MALDEPKKDDETFKFDKFEFLVGRDFLEKVKPIKVDFLAHGFKIDCGVDFSSGCKNCDTNDSCSS